MLPLDHVNNNHQLRVQLRHHGAKLMHVKAKANHQSTEQEKRKSKYVIPKTTESDVCTVLYAAVQQLLSNHDHIHLFCQSISKTIGNDPSQEIIDMETEYDTKYADVPESELDSKTAKIEQNKNNPKYKDLPEEVLKYSNPSSAFHCEHCGKTYSSKYCDGARKHHKYCMGQKNYLQYPAHPYDDMEDILKGLKFGIQFDDVIYCSVDLEHRLIHWQQNNSTYVGYIIQDIGYGSILAFCKPYVSDNDTFDNLSLEILKLKDLKYDDSNKIFICFDEDVFGQWDDWLLDHVVRVRLNYSNLKVHTKAGATVNVGTLRNGFYYNKYKNPRIPEKQKLNKAALRKRHESVKEIKEKIFSLTVVEGETLAKNVLQDDKLHSVRDACVDYFAYDDVKALVIALESKNIKLNRLRIMLAKMIDDATDIERELVQQHYNKLYSYHDNIL